MTVDLYCPLELRGYELLHDDKKNVRAYLSLFNLLDKRVARFEATVAFLFGDQSSEMTFTADQLRAEARTAFTVSISSGEAPDATELTIRFRRVAFEDGGEPWTMDEARLIELPEPPREEGRALNALMAVAGRDAVRFSEAREGYWFCVCGRANPDELGRCLRCRREREFVVEMLSRESVLSRKTPALPAVLAPEPYTDPEIPLLGTEQPAPQRKPRPSQATEAAREYRYQRGQLIRRTVTMLLIALLIALGALAWNWLVEKRDAAREMEPPVKVDQSLA